MKAPTEAQLKDPKWWDGSAPKNAQFYYPPTSSFLRTVHDAWFEYQPFWASPWKRVDTSYIDARHLYDRPAKPKASEWNGEGRPPVGCECEFSVHTFGKRAEFQRCEFLARSDVHGVSWVKTDDDFEVVYDSDQPVFRPIRTKEKRDLEEFARSLLDDLDALGLNVSGDTAMAVAIGFMNRGWHRGD